MKLGQRLYQSIFPPVFELPQKEQQLLKQMYPEIDWNYVKCCDGMPWFMRYTFAIGTALPDTFNSRHLTIYFKDYSQMPTQQRTAVLVHEALHIQQYQELNSMAKKTSGWGFNRRFIRYYLSWYLQGLYQAFFRDKKKWSEATYFAYRQHPMEIPAYNHEAFFKSHINDYRAHSISVFFQQIPELICRDAQLPKAPAFIFHSIGGLFSLLISVIKPLLELIFLSIALLLGGRKSTAVKDNSE